MKTHRLAQALLAGLAAQALAATPDIPDEIKAPAGEKIVLTAHASGSQIYVCQQNTDRRMQWILKAPDAQLRDDKGMVIGKHYAGPTWKLNDGSEVTGKAVAKVNSPDPNSIPWLLITAISNNGNGLLARVTSIQRVHTKGGQPPPAAECDGSKYEAEAKSPYTADYYFYAPGGR